MRWRYLWLSLWAVAWLTPAYLRSQSGSRETEWDVFVFGGRVLLGLHPPTHHFGALHLYVEYPSIQIGPPPLLLAGSLSWLTRPHSRLLGVLLILGTGVYCVRLIERTWPGREGLATIGGFLVLPIWQLGFGYYRHIDDAMATTLILAALCGIRRDRWLWPALGLGIAAASKPWAVIAIPLLLGLPRRDRVVALGAAAAAALAWWLPFLLGDRNTAHAVSSFSIPIDTSSVLHLVGLGGASPPWARAVQLGLGVCLVAILAARSRLAEALLAGVTIRILLDPAAWLYYDAPVVMAALNCDLLRGWPLPLSCSSVLLLGASYAAGSADFGVLAWALAALGFLASSLRAPANTAQGAPA